ncbi:class I SAM-dependent DNA methyltransferase [Pseudohalocynthiibacter aestuariivivens]|uniref:Class I SAM-dependent DNA methyltransferase n=1 Tax=Pseudohalocynthiibacter aestuariivivens TaxID=1591409 RepID=A0ABV5JEP9_9RHOB|nr:class I SAM-dependent methyltransferase [Pseudohalocynthiibacter aestuariivivens]MBS9716936.1 class I SAM-dependent methyltransferase [Pseudohalocynthiibacter aestuariivivens]
MTNATDTLEHVYNAEGMQAIRESYEGWASNYDAENIGNGFRLPTIGVAFVARHVPNDEGPILDAGCGTGLVGEALAILGYEDIVGLDISPAMLKFAERLETYNLLYEQDLGRPIPEADNSFAAVTCFGSLGPGHAPPDCLDEFIRVTRPGGHVIFNVRPDTYEEQGLRAKIDDLLAGPTVREVGRSGKS